MRHGWWHPRTAIPLAALLVCGEAACATRSRDAGAACRIERPVELPGVVPPTMSELRPLLADAERRVDRLGAGGRDPLGTRLHDLQRSLDGAPPRAADRCRALAAARAAAARLPPSPATAADRSAIALVLDLAAATLHDLDESHR